MTNAEERAEDRRALLALIAQDGVDLHVMSPSGHSGTILKCAIVLGGYALTEDGEIVSPDRWFAWNETLEEP